MGARRLRTIENIAPRQDRKSLWQRNPRAIRARGCTSGVKLTEAEDRSHAEALARHAEPSLQRCKQSAAAPTLSVQMTEWPLAPDGKCTRNFRHSDSVRKCYSGTRTLHRDDLRSKPALDPSQPQKKAAQQRSAKI